MSTTNPDGAKPTELGFHCDEGRHHACLKAWCTCGCHKPGGAPPVGETGDRCRRCGAPIGWDIGICDDCFMSPRTPSAPPQEAVAGSEPSDDENEWPTGPEWDTRSQVAWCVHNAIGEWDGALEAADHILRLLRASQPVAVAPPPPQ